MKKLSTAAQMRESDRITIEELGLPGIALMESAGRGAAEILLRAMKHRDIPPQGCLVRIFCGGGNNGGDGLVIARELLNRRAKIDLVLLAEPNRYRGDALVNLKVLRAILDQNPDLPCTFSSPEALSNAPRADVLVDALLGTGLDKTVRGHYRTATEAINRSRALTLAVDIPSGLHADTGQVLGIAVKADLTATFGLSKCGLHLDPGRKYTGTVHTVDIGIPTHVFQKAKINTSLLTRAEISRLLPPRPLHGHKGTFGHVLAFGGASGMGGALALCARAAIRGGAGLVTAAGAPDSIHAITIASPEIMTCNAWSDPTRMLHLAPHKTLVAGPGLGTSPKTKALLQELLAISLRGLVLDADALNIFASFPQEERFELLQETASRTPTILTPHPAEMARLLDADTKTVLSNQPGAARTLATRSGCIVLCKSATTVLANPQGHAAINTTGNPGMGTGGSGDVLAGLLAALLAQKIPAWDAARIGVYLHGLAGDCAAQNLGQHAMTASDLVHHLSEAFQTLPIAEKPAQPCAPARSLES